MDLCLCVGQCVLVEQRHTLILRIDWCSEIRRFARRDAAVSKNVARPIPQRLCGLRRQHPRYLLPFPSFLDRRLSGDMTEDELEDAMRKVRLVQGHLLSCSS